MNVIKHLAGPLCTSHVAGYYVQDRLDLIPNQKILLTNEHCPKVSLNLRPLPPLICRHFGPIFAKTSTGRARLQEPRKLGPGQDIFFLIQVFGSAQLQPRGGRDSRKSIGIAEIIANF